jgi:hypothetical protein
MNAYAIFAVNEHLEFLLEDAAQRRAREARKGGRSRGPGRTSRFVASFDRSIGRAARGVTGLVPPLTEAPSRS